MFKLGGGLIWRLGIRTTIKKYSTPSATVVQTDLGNGANEKASSPAETNFEKTGLVAAVFATLNDPLPDKPSTKLSKENHTDKIDTIIKEAEDVDSLLAIGEGPVISRRHALKIVSVLSEWSTQKKVKISEFEKDPRFLRLCRILARTSNTQAKNLLSRNDALSTVLGITGDDEAARLISNLTVQQMIKVMQALAQQSRRSTPLLRALANNITERAEPIDLKKSADLLFSMTTLSFPDPVLMDRICNDVKLQLSSNDKVSVVTSIVTSLGLLKYRHEEALVAICDWLAKNVELCRPQDIASAVVTLGTLNFLPLQAGPLIEAAVTIKESELVKSSCWLDLVFSLMLLQKATTDHVANALKPDFIERLLALGEIPITVRRKLIALDAYVSLSEPNYKGPRLTEDISVGVPVVYTKEKQLYVQLIMDTFKNFISSANFLKRNCNSGMGFLYDGEFAVDEKSHPVPLNQAANNKNVFHIAVLGLDYHDMCRKTAVPLGVMQLYTTLLELKGFKVLQIPYTDFNPRDKLITRIQYIEKSLKELMEKA